MVRAKKIYILIIKVNKLFSSFSSVAVFSKRYYSVIETRFEVWENEKCYGNTVHVF